MAITQTTVEVTMGSTTYAQTSGGSKKSTGVLIDAGCDWLSVTASHGETAESLRDLAHAICEAEIERGMEVGRAPMRRYTGFRAGQCAFGERPEDVMLQLSGAAAQAHVQAAVPLARTVSRVDVQVTVEMPSADAQIADRGYKRAKKGTGRKGRPVSARLLQTTSGGRTLYLGAPTSDSMVRVYDKGIESDTAREGKVWRCETVHRKRLAMPVARALVEEPEGELTPVAIVSTELERKGGRPFWSDAVDNLRFVSCQPRPADAHRKLDWLRAQVRPSVAWLCMRGFRGEVLEALGLDESALTYLDDSSQP